MADVVRILLVDEDLDSRVATKRALQRAQLGLAGEVGYGTDAVSLALSVRPDLFLIAVEEPIGRSLETAEALSNALPLTPFIVYSTRADAESVRRGMVSGAGDYLLKPIQAARLRDAVDVVLERAERRQARSAGDGADLGGRGTVITLAGAKGGIGKSVVCVNLALALRHETGRSVVLIDADTDFGDVATMLDLYPARTLGDLFPRLERLDRESIREHLTEHASGLQVLAAPPDGEVWEQVDASAMRRVIELLAATHDFVLVDTRGAFDRLVRTCVEASTLTLVVTTGEVSSIRDTSAAMRRLSTWDVEASRLKIVLNHGARVNGFEKGDLREALGHEIFWELPHDRQLPLSVQVGHPVVLDGKSPAARNLTELARRVAGLKSTSSDAVSPWRRFLRSRIGRKG